MLRRTGAPLSAFGGMRKVPAILRHAVTQPSLFAPSLLYAFACHCYQAHRNPHRSYCVGLLPTVARRTLFLAPGTSLATGGEDGDVLIWLKNGKKRADLARVPALRPPVPALSRRPPAWPPHRILRHCVNPCPCPLLSAGGRVRLLPRLVSRLRVRRLRQRRAHHRQAHDRQHTAGGVAGARGGRARPRLVCWEQHARQRRGGRAV